MKLFFKFLIFTIFLNSINSSFSQSGINKFSDLRLSEITSENNPEINSANKSIKNIVEEMFETMYNRINSQLLLGMSKVEAQKVLSGGIKTIKEGVEKFLLGGPMTKAQLQEFNEIKNNAAAVSNLAMGLIAESLKSDNSSSSRPANGQQIGNANRTTNSSANKSSNEVCSYCKPYDRKGHYVKDFDISTRTYINARYIIRPGYKICSSCTGTGLQSIRGPGVCNQCNGEKLKKCSNCKGSGLKN